jgi:hypothetical protein
VRNRIIIDFNIDVDLDGNSIQLLNEDLKDFIEITHADPYVPNMPLIDLKNAMHSEHIDKRINVYERASQYDLLQNVEGTFMWMSPVADDYMDKYDLIQIKCDFNQNIYKDVVIYRKGYKLSPLEIGFLDAVKNNFKW